MSSHSHPVPPSPEGDDAETETLVVDAALKAKGVQLVKMEGRVFIRFTGVVKHDDLRVPYQLVPAQGVLAKPSKWRKMDPEAQRALVLERASGAAIDALHQSVAAFVREISELADDCDFDAMTFLQTLAEMETSDPAEHVYDRIRQRIIHAVEREQEERHAARTKQSINLAEYPDS
ncbi:MAG: RNA helicase, partial [Telluria sp.]